MNAKSLADLTADLGGRVERTHRILGNERDVVPRMCLHLLLAQGDQVDPIEFDLPDAICPFPGRSRMMARPEVVLPHPDSPTRPTHSPSPISKREAADGRGETSCE